MIWSGGGAKIELVDGDEDSHASRRREGDIAEGTLQAACLLQDEGAVVLRHHAHPGKTHGIHVAGLVHARRRMQSIAHEIERMVEHAR